MTAWFLPDEEKRDEEVGEEEEEKEEKQKAKCNSWSDSRVRSQGTRRSVSRLCILLLL